MSNASMQPVTGRTLPQRYWRPPPPSYLSDPAWRAEHGTAALYWRAAARHWRTLAVIACLGPALGVVAYLLQTPVYKARSSVEIRGMNDAFMNTASVGAVAEGGGSISPSDMATQVRLLQSPTLLEAVAGRLRKNPHGVPAAGPASALRRALHLESADPSRELEPREAARRLTVRPGGQTRLLDIQFDSTSPELAADYANTLTAAFIDASMDARLDAAKNTGAWLTQQLAELRTQLESSENALQTYARGTGLLFTSDTTSVSEEKLRQLQEELSRAQADRMAKQARYELMAGASADALVDPANTSLRTLREQLTDLRRKRAELITTYTENHSSVKKIDSQIAPLEAAARNEEQNILGRIRNEYDAATRREALLTTRFQTQSRSVTDEAGKSVQYHILQRQVASNQQLYDAMLQRSKEVTMAAALRATAVRVVDAAQVPDAPYLPHLGLNLALGLMSSLGLAVVFTATRARMDRSLRGPGHAAALLNVSELGVIPKAVTGRSWRRRATDGSATLTTSPQPLPPGASAIDLALDGPTDDGIVQSFRGVLTSIMSAPEDERPTALAITSCNSGEGKTTITGNLAAVLAETGARVLVVDADLHRPRLHEVLGLPNERGLTTLLAPPDGHAPATLQGCVQPTATPRVFALTAGPAHTLGSGLLYSGGLSGLLDECRQHFDMVLVDTPPMLQIPDARLVGRLVDGLVLVAKADSTTIDQVVAARQRLAADGTPVLGTILNAWRRDRRGYSSYGGYPAAPA